MTKQLGQPLNLMLIEHKPNMVNKIKSLLSDPSLRYPHQVIIREFKVLSEAYSRIPGDAWDIIIFDMNIPHSDGLPTFKKIAAVSGVIPVIVIVDDGNFSFDLKEELLAAGASSCLRKGRLDNDPELLPDEVDSITFTARKTATIDRLIKGMLSQLHLIGECPRCRRWKHEGDEKHYPPHVYLNKYDINLNTSGAWCPECVEIYREEILGSEAEVGSEEISLEERPRRNRKTAK